MSGIRIEADQGFGQVIVVTTELTDGGVYLNAGAYSFGVHGIFLTADEAAALARSLIALSGLVDEALSHDRHK